MEAIIVPCTEEKVWTTEPARGAMPAKDAYTGTNFHIWRTYAEKHGGEWFVLSTKYGLLRPTDPIPGPYDVPIGRARNDSRLRLLLAQQGAAIDFSRFERVILLDSDYFESLVRAAVDGAAPTVLRRVVFKGRGKEN